MNALKTISIVVLASIMPSLTWGSEVTSLFAMNDDVTHWMGTGVSFDAELEESTPYRVDLMTRRINENQRMERLTIIPEGGLPRIVTCIVTLTGKKQLKDCDSGTGETVVLGSVWQTIFHADDGTTADASGAIDDGGERMRIMRTYSIGDDVILYAHESMQRVQ